MKYEKEIKLKGIPIHICEKAPKDIIQISGLLGVTHCPYCGEKFK